MTTIKASNFGSHAKLVALACTMLSGIGVAHAQQQAPAEALPPPPATPVAGSQQEHIVKSLKVEGSQRIEPATILSYTKLRVGETYTNATIDQAIKDLLASDFLADVSIEGVETGNLIIHVKENPVINRIVIEGNKHLKDDKIKPEIKLAPRQIFTRTAVRADVARIIELYRRQGRFGATVDPQMVSLDQNRVDVIFEIHEGPKSKVRAINIIGNHKFSDSELRSQMATKQSKWFRLLSSNTTYDQDRLSYDQQKLRQFYLTQGYADFRVTSAVAELTPDKRDFIITYVVEEGDRYKFGPVTVHSGIRDFDEKKLTKFLPMKEGDWYNAKQVEDTVDQLTQTAGTFGYAFADVRPQFTPDRKNHTMAVEFNIGESKRTYVERINITGNTQTKDKVIRREMRLVAGDPFNSLLVKRSEDRINSLGYFQDKFEIKQSQGSTDDRVVLDANVQEKPTGQLSLSAGFSSLERFIVQGSIQQNNFRGMGQTARAQIRYSTYAKSAEIGFTEPYLFDRPIALGGTIFRRDYNSFNYLGNDRNTTYSQVSTGFQIFSGVPLTEYWTLTGNYTLSQTDVTLDKNTFYSDRNGDGIRTCDPVLAGRYLCDAVGNRLTSMIGLQVKYSSLNSGIRPTRGEVLSFGVDFAGLGGDVRYLRGTSKAAKYWNVGSGFIFSLSAEGGVIKSLESDRGPGVDNVRITDRFYLGQQQFRGFDIRGVGPRVQRLRYSGDPANGTQALITDRNQIVDDALGGKAYYLGKAELEIPLGSGARELGLRPSIFAQVGALFGLKKPILNGQFTQATGSDGQPLYNKDGSPTLLPREQPVTDSNGKQVYIVPQGAPNAGATTICKVGFAASTGGDCTGSTVNTAYTTTTAPYYERYLGDSASPRLTVGIGVDWNSPFGPLRLDLAKAILTQPGDDTKLFTFNVGTQF